jgi:hypothetical protein
VAVMNKNIFIAPTTEELEYYKGNFSDPDELPELIIEYCNEQTYMSAYSNNFFSYFQKICGR